MFAILGLGGGEIVLLFLAMGFFLMMAGGIVALVLWLNRKNKQTAPFQTQPPIEKTKRICPSCAKEMSADAPQGLCPTCLMKVGLGSQFGDATQSPRNPSPALSSAEIGKLFP
ncbi:MAG: hypothetical protein JWM68_5427 [Verrucomicrobiales bacterium]|nr:hypothetical protein [Verrucomicrobiales bacterium]